MFIKRVLVLIVLSLASLGYSQNYNVSTFQKINELQGNFSGDLDNEDFFGISIDDIGDLDGNGVNDLAVGAYADDDGGFNKGAVWILFLDSDDMVISHTKISNSSGGFGGVLDDDDRFGGSVGYLGDLNGDGLIEIAVGADYDGDGGFWHGAVWILSLNSNGTVNSYSKISDTEGGFTGFINGDAIFGTDIANIGDLNGDGIQDLAVSSRRDHDGGPRRGTVWILFMNSDFTVNSYQQISDTQGGFTAILEFEDYFGGSVANIGDLNGDGIVDLAVGSYRDDDGEVNSGSFYILFLNSDGTVNNYQKVSNTQGGLTSAISSDALFGESIDGVIDIDGDGKIEIVVGAMRQVNPILAVPTGAFFIIELNTDGTVSEEHLYTYAENCFSGQLESGDLFGGSVCVLSTDSGEIKVAVGAYSDSENGSRRGSAWILTLGETIFNIEDSTHPTGCGFDDGSITISNLNANSDYTVTYNNEGTTVTVVLTSDGSGNIIITGLPSGIFDTIVVSDDLTGCTDNVGEVELIGPALSATISSTNPTDCGSDDGSTTISGLNSNTDFTVAYDYEGITETVVLTSDGSGNIIITGLTSGIYDTIVITETVTDCTADLGQIELIGPALSATISSTNPTDCGSDDGSTTISGLNSNTDYTVAYDYEGTTETDVLTSDGSGNIIITGLTSGIYDNIVVLEDNSACEFDSGLFELTCIVEQSDCEASNLFFSPNSDGYNDFLVSPCVESYPINTMKIFNRHGIMVYENKNYINNWNGIPNKGIMKSSKVLPVGTYFYVFEANNLSSRLIGWIYLTH